MDGGMEAQYIRSHHTHEIRENQCSSTLVKHIKAPVHLCDDLISCKSTSHLQNLEPGFLSSQNLGREIQNMGSARNPNLVSSLANYNLPMSMLTDDQQVLQAMGMRMMKRMAKINDDDDDAEDEDKHEDEDEERRRRRN